jgi:hypothetical protein
MEKASQTYLKFFRSSCLSDLVDWIAEDGCGAAGVAVGVDEGCAFDAVAPLPVDCKGSVGFFDMERFGVAAMGEAEREVIVAIDEPGIAGFTGNSMS